MTFNYKQNKLRQIMEKRQKEKEEIKEFNKSDLGKELIKTIKQKHEQTRIDPKNLPF